MQTYIQLYTIDSDGNKQAMQTILAQHKIDELPHHKRGLSYTASGYGKKIPSIYKVFFNGRWYRVYTCVFSNIGTSYITAGGADYVVSFA